MPSHYRFNAGSIIEDTEFIHIKAEMPSHYRFYAGSIIETRNLITSRRKCRLVTVSTPGAYLRARNEIYTKAAMDFDLNKRFPGSNLSPEELFIN